MKKLCLAVILVVAIAAISCSKSKRSCAAYEQTEFQKF
jgi:hypothetical protein